jgi:hypothetical protein
MGMLIRVVTIGGGIIAMGITIMWITIREYEINE